MYLKIMSEKVVCKDESSKKICQEGKAKRDIGVKESQSKEKRQEEKAEKMCNQSSSEIIQAQSFDLQMIEILLNLI